MRHLNTGRKLGVDNSHRTAMMRSLTLALIEHEGIRTTPARAKELRWFADRVVTWAKRGDLAGRRQIVKLLGSTESKVAGQNRVRIAIERVYTLLVPRFEGRNGGYTQIIRFAERRPGDNAEMCYMRYLPGEEKKEKTAKKDAKTAKAKSTDSKKKASAASDKAEVKADKADKKPTAKAKKKEKED